MSTQPDRTIGVTGAAGFVGRSLARALAASGASVRPFGRQAGDLNGLQAHKLAPDPAAFRGLGAVAHLAAITSNKTDPAILRAANVTLVVDIARAAAEAGVGRFVFFSSIGVHGKASRTAVKPDSPFAPDNAYGRSKAEAEEALRRLCPSLGMELVVIRPPMIYGPGCKGSFAALAKLVKTGAPLPLGAAKAPRSLCSLSNVVSASMAALAAERPPQEAFLPADPDDHTTRSLVEGMREAAGSRTVLVPIPRPLMAIGLRAVGMSEFYQSLFDPLVIDRGHWRSWGWIPPADSRQAVREAAASLMAG